MSDVARDIDRNIDEQRTFSIGETINGGEDI